MRFQLWCLWVELLKDHSSWFKEKNLQIEKQCFNCLLNFNTRCREAEKMRTSFFDFEDSTVCTQSNVEDWISQKEYNTRIHVPLSWTPRGSVHAQWHVRMHITSPLTDTKHNCRRTRVALAVRARTCSMCWTSFTFTHNFHEAIVLERNNFKMKQFRK